MDMMPLILSGGTTTDLQNIISQISPVLTMVGNVVTQLLANELFQFFFACGFVKIGFGLFRRAKRIAK